MSLNFLTVRAYSVITLFLIVSYLAAFLSYAEQQDESSAENVTIIKPIIAPEADKALKSMGETLSSYSDFSFRADITFDELLPSGQKIQYSGQAEIAVSRPDQVHASLRGDLIDRKLWYSDETLTVLNMNDNFYGQLAVPADLDSTMDFLIDNYDFTLPLADMIHSSPYDSLITNVLAGVIVGTSNMGGKECLHLAFVEKYIDWQVWISQKDQNLPCKLVITYKTIPGSPQYSALFSDWRSGEDAGLKDDIYKPQIPEGAVKIEYIKMQREEK